jgi:succinate dehydrogenase / fumarate reductase membrane anchor subunit
MIAGVVILILLGLHMVTMHVGGLTGLFVQDHAQSAVSEANSKARDSNPLFMWIYIPLLGIALYHGLYGLRTILFELSLKPVLEKAITAVLLLAGLGLFGLGTWAAIAAHGAALATRG